MSNFDPNYFRNGSIRAVVTRFAQRFTPVDAAKNLIVERTLLIIMQNPEVDLTDLDREILPVIRQVALDHFQVQANGQVNESRPEDP